MHTALVARLLRDRSLWVETTEAGDVRIPARAGEVAAHIPREA
jgi:hypothetical protein